MKIKKVFAWSLLSGNALFAWYFMFWFFHVVDREVWWVVPTAILIVVYTCLSGSAFVMTAFCEDIRKSFNEMLK